jgi:hypothetical protein
MLKASAPITKVLVYCSFQNKKPIKKFCEKVPLKLMLEA